MTATPRLSPITVAVIVVAILLFAGGMWALQGGHQNMDAHDAEIERIHASKPSAPSAPPSTDEEPGIGDGVHLVNRDIKPGIYTIKATGTCYWARLRDVTGEISDVIANGNNAPEIVEVQAGDAAFESRGCGRWVPVEETYFDPPLQAFRNGTVMVGKHIEPGTYRAEGTQACYWARLSNFSHEVPRSILANGTSPTTVRIKPTDAGFTSVGCGPWMKMP